jgi:hypothetical protein
MLAIEIWKLNRVALKVQTGSGVGEWGKRCRGCWFLLSSCVFIYISAVVVTGACVRDCRGLGLCKFGIVVWSVGDDYVGGKCSLVTG